MKAYVTLLSTDSYLDGVLALNESLKMVGAKYPLVVVLSSEVSPLARKALQALKLEVIEIEEFNYTDSLLRKNLKWGMPHWNKVSDKFRVFGLTQFEKIVYIDADMFVLKNIDHLFDWPHYSATSDSPMIFEENLQSHQQLNAGLIVIEPSKELEEKLTSLSIQSSLQDQDALRANFPDWVSHSELHLPQEYNIFTSYWSEYEKKGIKSESVTILHYIGQDKFFNQVTFPPVKDKILFYWNNLYLKALFQAQSELEKLDIFREE